MGVLAMIATIFIIPESPKFLISKKHFDEARDAINKIARLNGKWQRFDGQFEQEVALQANFKAQNETNLPLSMVGSEEVEKEETKQLDGSLRDLFKIRRHTINLAILLCMWSASSFNIYLLNFVTKYLGGDIFVNSLVTSLSDIPFAIAGGFIFHKFGIRAGFTTSLIIAIIGSLAIIFASNDNPHLVPIMLTFARNGIKVCFDICYLGNSLLFPAIFAGTAFGICNVGAKTATILSPLLAEIEAPIPMIVFTSIGIVAIGLTQFIRTPSKGEI